MPRKKVVKKNSVKMDERPQKSLLFHILPAVILIVLLAFLFYARSFFLAASVNGEPIYRSTLNETLFAQSGKDVLDGLIAEKLILQEAKNRKITVSDQEINDQIKTIEKSVSSQGQKLDQLLAMQGLTRDKLKEQVKVQKMVEKMFAKDITVSEKEIDDFIKANEQFLSANANTNQDQVRGNVREQLKQNKLREKTRDMIEKLKKTSKIDYFVNAK